MQVGLRSGGRSASAQVIDVSETGIRLAAPGAYAVDETVTVETPRMVLTGNVQWARGGEIGVRLDTRLSASQQTELTGLSWGM